MDPTPQRVDRWLWASRLVKTRALAAEAVKGGRVHVNGARVKPSREVGPGDELELLHASVRRTVIIHGTAPRRGPAPEAQQLYTETEASIAAREAHAAQRRLDAPPVFPPGSGRPTKRDRRRMDRARRR